MRQLRIMRIISSHTPLTLGEAAKTLLAGNLVAFPTETVYGLGADANNEKAVARIYQVKGRPIGHPVIVHIASVNSLEKWAKNIPEYAIRLARIFWPGPMTLILPRTDLAKNFITGGQNNIGIRVPAHDVALTLLKEFEHLGGLGVAAPSANRFGKISPTCANDVEDELSDNLTKNDLILDGGNSSIGVESTIIDCTKNSPIILRPGGITATMISNLLNLPIEIIMKQNKAQIKTPGLFKSHYSPIAKLYFSGIPAQGDGFIALSKFSTPKGTIRLANPKNNEEYARVLYHALRLADKNNILNIYVQLPNGDDIAVAICDRLKRASVK